MKRLFVALLALISLPALAQFTPGQILTAAALNAQFALYTPISGGTLTGPLTVPTLNTANAQITGGSVAASTLSGTIALGRLPTGTSGSAIPVLNAANTWSATQTFSVPIAPAAGIAQTGGSAASVNLTGSNATGFYATGGGATYSFYPTIGFNAGDHQRAQQLVSFNTTQNGTISETGISINATINSGIVPAWAQSTVYATGALIDTAGNVYQATTGGTSASTGTGPSGAGSAIADGTVTWAYQCVDQCNAKMPFFVSAVAGPNAGKSWAGDVALTLQPGWAGGFAPTWEVDLTNNSGSDCATCQNLLLTGNAGTNKSQAASSAYGPSATNYNWINGYQVTGAKAVTNASFYDAAAGTYSYEDVGAHTYGLYLNGNYGTGAAWMNQSMTLQYDFARINLFPASASNLNRWRLISNASGSSAGSLVFQTTTDGFVSSFITPVTMNTNGSVTLGAGGTTSTVNGTLATPALTVNSTSVLPNLSGTSGSIGGSALAAGACTSGTVAVANSATSMAVVATPATYPGDGIFWHGYVSAAGTVTVKVCATIAATPTASAYNVRVLQ